MDMKLV
jgi:hypothetical protein